MTLIGLGSDLIDIRRIERSLERYGQRFIDRVFTPEEQATAARRTGALRAATFAKRYAAKEACAKALGTGFAEGVTMHGIEVRSLPSGAPTLSLSGAAKARAEALGASRLHLSLTHGRDVAAAVVILEGSPL